MSKIKQIKARQILNSKGIPTVEVSIILEDGVEAVSSTPTGTSVGTYEAQELRDADSSKYGGLGVLKAVENVTKIIAPQIIGIEAENQHDIDRKMIQLDGTM